MKDTTSQAAFLIGAIQAGHPILDAPQDELRYEAQQPQSGSTDENTTCSNCCSDGHNCAGVPLPTHPPLCPGVHAAPQHASWSAQL
jgi:hypothetical protein